MQRHRPTAVLVMAVLNMVFGGLGILGMLCMGAGVALLAVVIRNAPPPPGGGPNPVEIWKAYADIPGIIPYLIVSLGVGLLMSIVLFASGLGLLKMQSWARWLSVVYGVYGILAAIAALVYSVAVLNPKMIEVQQKQLAGMPGAAGNPFAGPNVFVSDIGSVVGALIGVAYPIAVLVVMFLPHVSRAFAGEVPEQGHWTRNEPEDYHDRRPTYGEPEEE